MPHLPEVVAHADWGTAPAKRSMAVAIRQGDRYLAKAASPAGDSIELISRLRVAAGDAGCVFLGFDFPIGVPEAYASRAGVTEFMALLPLLGQGRWANFFNLNTDQNQISLERPFYPFNPGGRSQSHLLKGLGVSSINELRRLCERRTTTRGDACSLFWTLGGNQVGRAAILGWREVIVPATKALQGRVKIWPFDGKIGELLAPDQVVIVETYPTEFYRHLGLSFPPSKPGYKTGKRVQRDRRANAPAFLAEAKRIGFDIDAALKAQIEDGFGAHGDGEDLFDAVVGLFGMLNILIGGRVSGEPTTPAVQKIEGWILGQASA